MSDFKTSRSGKTVHLNISIWYQEDDREIRIQSDEGGGFISTVSSDRDKKRGNPHLYKKLASILKAADAPHPVDS